MRAPEVRDVQRRHLATSTEVASALHALDGEPLPIRAGDWPIGLTGLEKAGLYAWWIDAKGVRDLASGTDLLVAPGRIYAGQTGATHWPSGQASGMTLGKRLGRHHLGGKSLGGSVRGSTFRLTLAGALRQPLQLICVGPSRLDPESERHLSRWMREHLRLAVFPFDDRDSLRDLEHRVLAALDPPLNIDGMPPTPLRIRLAYLRGQIASGKPDAPALA